MGEKIDDEMVAISDDMLTFDSFLSVLEDDDMRAICKDKNLLKGLYQNKGSLENLVSDKGKEYYDKIRLLYEELVGCFTEFGQQDPNEWFDSKFGAYLDE